VRSPDRDDPWKRRTFFVRGEPALYQERSVKPRRLDATPRVWLELRRFIWCMATENPLFGQARIENALLPKRPPGSPRGDRRWSTFLRERDRRMRRLRHCNGSVSPEAADQGLRNHSG